MNITAYCLKNPVGIGIAIALICFIGVISLFKLPVQLYPDMENPQMSIWTAWRAAAPNEVESELIEPIEDVLEGLPGLQEIKSTAFSGGAWMNMRFALGTNMQKMMIDVISRLNRLRPLPADALQPVIQLGGWSGGQDKRLTSLFVQALPGNPRPIQEYSRLIDEVVKSRLESIPGVAGIVDVGVARQELQIIFDPYRMAELGIDVPRIAALAGRSTDVSGGQVDVGRRQYTVRFAGRYDPEELRNLILDWRAGQPVRLGDVAEVKKGHARIGVVAYQNGNPAFYLAVNKTSGANVLDTLEAVRGAMVELNEGPLASEGLSIVQSFDPSVFIKRAISLVQNNILVGLLLATGILWWFLRHARATLMIALTVPISLLSTFIVLMLAGRTLNVISLAGLAFSVGMVMDAAIVVLENIIRLREKGRSPEEAAAQGTAQVWGALLASTATTVAIFVPVLFLHDKAGQLFADLALTIAIGVSISLIVAVTVLPTLGQRWLHRLPDNAAHQARWDRMARRLMALTGSPRRRLAWIAGLIGVSLSLSYVLLPKLNYLPSLKRDEVASFMSTPPGAAIETIERDVLKVAMDRLEPYLKGEKEPAIKDYSIWTWSSGGYIGARPQDPSKVSALIDLMNGEILAGLPDTTAFAMQTDLFGGFSEEGKIAINLQSTDTIALLKAATLGIALLHKELPGAGINPPAVDGMAEPELSIEPIDERIVEAGWSRADVARIIRALGDGLWLGEYFDGENRLDIILKSRQWADPESLGAVPLATPAGYVTPLGALVNIRRTVGPSQLVRVDGRRTFSLVVSPPDNLSLQETLDIIRAQVEPALKAALPADGGIRYGGSADDLDNAISSMSANFALALALLFLLMAALFRSLRDAALVVIAIPLATVGGVIALRLLNLFTFQPLDLLTMIGFIILLGLVVNNAILLVHQTRRGEAAGLSRAEAVEESLRRRLRPIFMSTLTSIFGMMPLLLFPGEGSAIYRGLAAAIVGGMAVSTLFTLILLPALMRMGEGRTGAVSAPVGAAAGSRRQGQIA